MLTATPGRLLDHIERGRVLLNDVKILNIDEADRMLDMGFIPDVERIVSLLPRIHQTLFFPATLDRGIRELADGFLINPKSITVAPPSSTAETVEQFLLVTEAWKKRAVLRTLIDREDVGNALIFCNRKRDVGIVHRSLVRHGYDAVVLHGDMLQPARTKTLTRFKAGDAPSWLQAMSQPAASTLPNSATCSTSTFRPTPRTTFTASAGPVAPVVQDARSPSRPTRTPGTCRQSAA